MLGALSFTSPLILLSLLALPVVWFLLRATPPSPKETRFPAFIILRQLTSSEETPARTPWQLLLLRLLLAALVIVGLSGPVLNAPPPAPGAGPLVLAVDDTWAAAASWGARRDAIAKAAAEAEQSDRPFFVVTTAPQRTPAAIEPLSGEAARDLAASLAPQPFAADRAGAGERLTALDRYAGGGRFEIRWLSDGAAGSEDKAFADALRARGDVVILNDARAAKSILRPAGESQQGPRYRIERLGTAGAWAGAVVASARDGRELARLEAQIEDGARAADVTVDLPLALRNELASVRIEGVASAGAVQLIDARDRRAFVGLVTEAQPARNDLLSGAHYIRQALGPYAEFVEDTLDGVLAADVSVIVLDDIGALRASEMEALRAWVNEGGVLIRFAGPVLAEAAQDAEPPLLPVPLRGGGRAFGGALTWETPQKLAPFPEDGPFAGLAPPEDALVRRQVLAQPGGETTERSWARLEDGTPLVTGAPRGRGVIALFHVTATPGWSDLPISGVFIEMLRRLIFLSALGPEGAGDTAQTRFPPLRLLDGFGRLRPPADEDAALTAAELAQGPSPERPPGLYGAADAPLALNAVNADTPYAPLSVPDMLTVPYVDEPPQRLGPPLFAAALALLLIDGIATLFLSGRLRWARAAAAMLAFAALPLPPPAQAQPLDPPINEKTAEAALETRLAYVETGDPAMDRLSQQALAGLSRELYRRTALEPGPPAAVDPETDDLSVYPFLYWPIVPGAQTPSDVALANIENFMRFGGLILFDTRDDERAVAGAETPETRALQRILSQLNIPPLTPVGPDHVLTRSFYLLRPLPVNDLPGRVNANPVWVQADASDAADNVTPLIIGGRDWAGAWATDQFGRPVRPMGAGGEIAREFAYRAGVNIVMVAFTGNYKSDQVHAPILLERLGR